MSKKKVILISGKQGAGKTTLANMLQKNLMNYTSTKVEMLAFADTLYRMHDFCLGVLSDSGFDRGLKKDGELLQWLGTEWGRKIDKDIWVKIVQTRINRIMSNTWAENNIFIISDCRFENEIDNFPDALKIRLTASEAVRKPRCSYWRENSNHPSEVGLDAYESQEKFDLVYDTGKESTATIAVDVIATLRSMNFMQDISAL